MEAKVQKILKLLKEEDEEDRSTLVDLIEDFHMHYQSVYDRYDHLTGELRSKIDSKKDKDSSSSSDSDSDSSPTKKGSQKKKSGNDLHTAGDGIKEELLATNMEAGDLTEKLTMVTEEKETLYAEYQSAVYKAEEAENKVGEFKLEADRLKDENSQLLHHNNDLNSKLDTASRLEVELNQKIEETTTEKEQINIELTAIINQLKDEKEVLRAESEDVKREYSKIEEALKFTEEKALNLNQTVLSAEEERVALLKKISEMENKIKTEHDKARELIIEGDLLREKLDEREKDLLSHIKNLTENFRNLQLELESMHGQKGKLEEQGIIKSNAVESLESQKIQLEMQLEEKNKQVSEYVIQINVLKQELATKSADEQKLQVEKERYISQVRDLEEDVTSLNSLKAEAYTDLEKRSLECVGYSIQIEILKEEVANKTSHHERALAESEAQLKKKTTEISGLILQIESLREELANKSEEHWKILDEKDSHAVKVNELTQDLNSTIALKNVLEDLLESKNLENSQLKSSIVEMEKLLAESELKLERRIRDLSDNLAKTESLKAELASKMADAKRMIEDREALTSHLKELETKADFVSNQKIVLEDQIHSKGEEIDSLNRESENLKANTSELQNEIMTVEKTLKLQEEAQSRLGEQYERLQEKLRISESKSEKMSAELNKNIQSKEQMVAQLDEIVENLKRNMEIKEDKVGTLEENVQNLEVKLRLSNQKLRLTEQLLAEKDEQNSKEEKLRQENKMLLERISSFSGAISCYKAAETRVKNEVKEKVMEIFEKMDSLAVKFEEDYGHIETCVYEIANEIKVTKAWIRKASLEKEKLTNEVNDKTEKELMSREKLQKEEEEKETLKRLVKGLEAKMGELEGVVNERDEKLRGMERMLREKDEGILDLGEEKREVIRQLCVWIDYERDQCDYLRRMLPKPANRQRLVHS